MNLVLIGHKSCGKTSVGKTLAAKLEKKFIDTDELIMARYRSSSGANQCQTIREICHQHGEKYFRNLENEVIATLADLDNAIVATGGGVAMEKENEKNLKKKGMLIYLDLSFDEWKTRIEQQPLPTFIKRDGIAAHYAMRKSTYQKIADVTIPVDQYSVSDIVEMICIRMSGFDLRPVTCNL